jgi:hypothetical protein
MIVLFCKRRKEHLRHLRSIKNDLLTMNPKNEIKLKEKQFLLHHNIEEEEKKAQEIEQKEEYTDNIDFPKNSSRRKNS